VSQGGTVIAMMANEAEVESLTGFAMTFADRMLVAHGALAPFGGAIGPDGKIVHLGVDPEIGEPDRAIGILASRIRRSDATVAVLVVDIRIVPPGTSATTDCRMTCIESRDGVIVRGFLPYWRSGDGAITYGEKFFDPEPSPLVFVRA